MSRDHKKKENASAVSGSGTHRPIPEWLAVKLDFPPDVLQGGMLVDVRGRHSVAVHGCRRILYYGSEAIHLGMKDCVVRITGARLVCTSYLAGAVGVEGRIDSVCFATEEEGV